MRITENQALETKPLSLCHFIICEEKEKNEV